MCELLLITWCCVEDEEGEVFAWLSDFRVDGIEINHLFVGLDEGGHYYQLITVLMLTMLLSYYRKNYDTGILHLSK